MFGRKISEDMEPIMGAEPQLAPSVTPAAAAPAVAAVPADRPRAAMFTASEAASAPPLTAAPKLPLRPAAERAKPPAVADNCLMIGRGMTFSGVIATCEHLIVSGSVVSDTDACRKIDVSPGGSFRGTAKTDDADIAGIFEGDLTVHGCLRIRATGCVRGQITYGSIAIEQGGRLLGAVDQTEDAPAAPAAAPVIPMPTI